MLFNKEHEIICEESVKIQIKGASNRNVARKRFGVVSKANTFSCDFFGKGKMVDSLILRNKPYDALVQSTMDESNVAIEHAIPVQLFLEGEYWGQYYLQEGYDEVYFQQYYGVDANVRVTFDYNIISSNDIEHFLEPQIYGRGVLPYGKALMEVKFDSFLPNEIYQVLQLKDIALSNFSKYYLCRKFHT